MPIGLIGEGAEAYIQAIMEFSFDLVIPATSSEARPQAYTCHAN